MPDSKHDQWIDILSMSSATQQQGGDAPAQSGDFAAEQGGSTVALLLPAVQSLRESARSSGDRTDSFEFLPADGAGPAIHDDMRLTGEVADRDPAGGQDGNAPLPEQDDGAMSFIDSFDFF